jgi:GrpB-like predicted nucleotidyltransferase (UPF0157 family)
VAGDFEVVDWDPNWEAAAHTLAADLTDACGDALLRVHHVGSTAVSGLPAKPVLDLLAEVRSLPEIDACAPVLERMGFEAMGEYGIPGRRYFRRPEGPGPGVHLHTFAVGHPAIDEHIAFRDHLRAHVDERDAYGRLKRRLARRFAGDRKGYQAAKAPFIEALKARVEGGSQEGG